jgi:hypothetical protein
VAHVQIAPEPAEYADEEYEAYVEEEEDEELAIAAQH